MLWQKAKQAEITADGSVSFHPVSEVVEVPSEYEVAMEAALGTRLQTLLTTDSGYALQAVDHLKSSQAGRSSFFTDMDSAERGFSAAPTGEGVVGVLKDVVRADDKHQKSVSFILDGVVIVDSIRTALRLRPEHSGWTFVTQDGDTLTADGILTGGSSEGAESGVLKRRREIKELTELKNEWAGKLALAQAQMLKLTQQLDTVTSDFEGAKQRRIDQEMKVTELRKDLERAESEIQSAKYACERQQKEMMKIADQSSLLQSKVEELEQNLVETRERKFELESVAQTLQSELSSLKMSFDGMQNDVTDLKARSASKSQEYQGVQRHLEMVQRQVDDLNMQLSRMSEESQKNATVMTDSQVILEQRKIEFERAAHEVEQLKAQSAQAKNRYEEISAQVRELDEKQVKTSRMANERMHKMNDAQLKFEQAKMKEQYLVDQIRERYMLNLPEIFESHLGKEGDITTAESDLKDLRDKISKIGEVNLSAIEEYEDTAKRYEFLVQQQTDLNAAKEQLRRVIDRINRICSKRFKETFELVNERFQRVFPVLFGGGEARLELIEDLEKGDMGIEIIAKPPGKKMQNISLLSGGEKALTAVSLVFSIFLVKPSPYCLLDEVDAPLDDANVFRFNDLVREMAKRSQIIVVTHNKHTMEVASKLYGVTMQERGVSTMVSVNLQDIA
jgi:chromosome segregation protein